MRYVRGREQRGRRVPGGGRKVYRYMDADEKKLNLWMQLRMQRFKVDEYVKKIHAPAS